MYLVKYYGEVSVNNAEYICSVLELKPSEIKSVPADKVLFYIMFYYWVECPIYLVQLIENDTIIV